MRIIIDGDGCPQKVKEICEQAAKEFDIDLIIVVDIDHMIASDYKIIVVDKGRDSADYKIVEIFQQGDILVTQDYGLASLVLIKASAVIHTAGFFINKNNIDSLLQSRYIGDRIRKLGERTKGPSKRRKVQDENFKKCLYKVLNENKKNKSKKQKP